MTVTKLLYVAPFLRTPITPVTPLPRGPVLCRSVLSGGRDVLGTSYNSSVTVVVDNVSSPLG